MIDSPRFGLYDERTFTLHRESLYGAQLRAVLVVLVMQSRVPSFVYFLRLCSTSSLYIEKEAVPRP